ncbi:uncharacterized protein LOC108680920 [Hyalella azteca]|uniref:Uncharacterized protein LOC108680920 n=1 Tax=Hyalella azteca TaxID=294128 RepID=A0A8B7PH63_HYAAZ|nr:uncharacterized protein LOC108680920 [Hyalella azteca]
MSGLRQARMLRVTSTAFLVTVLVLSTVSAQDTLSSSEQPPQQEGDPANRIFGWPLPGITASVNFGTTVTRTVQVPLYIVRTSTVWGGGSTVYSYLPASTVYIPASTVYQGQIQTVFSTRTSYILSTVTSGNTVVVSQYLTVTTTRFQFQTLVSTVTSCGSSQVVFVTRTQVIECEDDTRTRTRTRTRTITRTFTDVGGTNPIFYSPTQTIPSSYLRTEV